MTSRRVSILFFVVASAIVLPYTLQSYRPYQPNAWYLLRVDNGWGSLGWAANHAPSDGQVLAAIDRQAQRWNQIGRVNVALETNTAVENIVMPCNCDLPPSQRTCGGDSDGINMIYHRPRVWCDGTYIASTGCDNPENSAQSDCDTVFLDGVRPFYSLDTNVGLDSDGKLRFTTSQDLNADFNRVVAHELGHQLGFDHTDQGGDFSKCQDPGSGIIGPQLCTLYYQVSADNGFMDEVEGLRSPSRYSTISRAVRQFEVAVAGGGTLTNLEATQSSTWVGDSIVPPRISCHPGTAYPDCVIAGTTSAGCTANPANNCVRLDTVYSEVDGWHRINTVVLPVRSLYDVDVALSDRLYPTPYQRAVAVRLDPVSLDYRWTSWDVDQTTTTYNGSFSLPGPYPAKGAQPPRVSWHRGINRFVAAFVLPNREIAISVSTGRLGDSWQTIETVAVGAAQARKAFGEIDISCPTHQSTNNECRILLNEHSVDQVSQYNGVTFSDHNRNQRGQVCRFSLVFQFNRWSPSGISCNMSDLHNGPSKTSIADYGANPPQGGPAGPAWMATVGRLNPAGQLNSAHIFSQNSPATFQAPLFGAVLPFDTAWQASSPPPWNLWGGVSCDYVEWTRRFLCVQLKETTRW